MIRARKSIDEKGVKHYEIYGLYSLDLYRPSTIKFDVLNDPKDVVIDFLKAVLWICLGLKR